jgi:hypothetical protein
VVAEQLREVEHQPWLRQVAIGPGSMDIRHDPGDPSALRFVRQAPRNGRGAHTFILPVTIG